MASRKRSGSKKPDAKKDEQAPTIQATPEQAQAIVAAVAQIDAQQIPQEDRIMAPERPRSRYEDVKMDEQDDSIYLPPHLNLDGMTKDQIAATSMRYLGRRPPEGATKEVQIAQVQRELRAGLPGYGRER